MLFNEYTVLQIISLISIFFLFWTSDVFTTIIIGVFYLLVMSLIALYLDSDVVISFVMVIDLGVFFIMFAFILHLTKFLTTKMLYKFSYKNLLYSSFIALFMFIYVYAINFNTNIDFNKTIEYSWFFFISYYNYYNISQTIFNSDMQLLKEIYFHINSCEFFIISILVYLGLVTSSVVFNMMKSLFIKNNLKLLNNLNKYSRANSSHYFKHQNFIKQSMAKANSKIWNKRK